MQLIVMTSDKYHHLLNPYFYLLDKYAHDGDINPIVCGFTYDSVAKSACANWGVGFYSIGEYSEFPPNNWSDAFKRVLDNVADNTFIFMLEDYWLCRHVDVGAVKMLYDYARSNGDVLKIDLANDRLYSDPGRYLYGNNTSFHLGHLDVIESPQGSQYQMSFWGGIFNKHNLYKVLVPGETAQEVELNGTTRVNQIDGLRVLGTRQCPVLHGNMYQGGEFVGYKHDTWRINDEDVSYMQSKGWIK